MISVNKDNLAKTKVTNIPKVAEFPSRRAELSEMKPHCFHLVPRSSPGLGMSERTTCIVLESMYLANIQTLGPVTFSYTLGESHRPLLELSRRPLISKSASSPAYPILQSTLVYFEPKTSGPVVALLTTTTFSHRPEMT